jgi:predicted ArsR family transcriptional regulator
VETAILELRERHGSLAYEQIAAQLGEPSDAVRNALSDLRDAGFVDVLAVGELEGHVTRAASYWRLTDAGREELARRRSG